MLVVGRRCDLLSPVLPRATGVKTTSWIPEEFAKVGKVLKLKEEDGWVVMSVGDRLDGEIANKRSVEYRKVPVSRK